MGGRRRQTAHALRSQELGAVATAHHVLSSDPAANYGLERLEVLESQLADCLQQNAEMRSALAAQSRMMRQLLQHVGAGDTDVADSDAE